MLVLMCTNFLNVSILLSNSPVHYNGEGPRFFLRWLLFFFQSEDSGINPILLESMLLKNYCNQKNITFFLKKQLVWLKHIRLSLPKTASPNGNIILAMNFCGTSTAEPPISICHPERTKGSEGLYTTHATTNIRKKYHHSCVTQNILDFPILYHIVLSICHHVFFF